MVIRILTRIAVGTLLVWFAMLPVFADASNGRAEVDITWCGTDRFIIDRPVYGCGAVMRDPALVSEWNPSGDNYADCYWHDAPCGIGFSICAGETVQGHCLAQLGPGAIIFIAFMGDDVDTDTECGGY